MADGMVQCSVCRGEVPSAAADVVVYGTGYRCNACTAVYEVAGHEMQSDAAWNKQNEIATGRFWIKFAITTTVMFVLSVALIFFRACR